MKIKPWIRINLTLLPGVILMISSSCTDVVEMPVPEIFETISAGSNHSLALEPDGTLWAWGNNRYGQLGDGTNNDSNTPVQKGSH